MRFYTFEWVLLDWAAIAQERAVYAMTPWQSWRLLTFLVQRELPFPPHPSLILQARDLLSRENNRTRFAPAQKLELKLALLDSRIQNHHAERIEPRLEGIWVNRLKLTLVIRDLGERFLVKFNEVHRHFVSRPWDSGWRDDECFRQADPLLGRKDGFWVNLKLFLQGF